MGDDIIYSNKQVDHIRIFYGGMIEWTQKNLVGIIYGMLYMPLQAWEWK